MRLLINIPKLALGAGLICLLGTTQSCHKPEAPEYYGFQDIQLSKTSGQQAILSTSLKFYNPNPFNIQLKSAEVDVALNGKPAGHSSLDSTILIPKKDTFYIPVTLQIDLKSIMGNALQILMERQVTVTLDGRVHLKRGMVPFSRPFHYEGKQDLSSLGF
jgi:LEA14-like dessication related protein